MIYERQKVLIVDDEKINLKVLSLALTEQSDILLAKNGMQAVTKAKEFKPDLILLDVIMPDMDGFEVIKLLKSDPATIAIPVIFVTALNDFQSEEKGFELGACDYIVKPFQLTSVKARVRLHLQLSRQKILLEELANIDPLTSIANRRRYSEFFDIEWHSAIRNCTQLSLVMIDIDFFKNYNDHYGHAAGDNALQKVARALSKQLRRPRDFIARYGGEEFVIILPETSRESSIEIMQACIAAVEALKIEHIKCENKFLSISAGGISCIPDINKCKEDTLKIADDMLYRAKQNGRNRVIWNDL